MFRCRPYCLERETRIVWKGGPVLSLNGDPYCLEGEICAHIFLFRQAKSSSHGIIKFSCTDDQLFLLFTCTAYGYNCQPLVRTDQYILVCSGCLHALHAATIANLQLEQTNIYWSVLVVYMHCIRLQLLTFSQKGRLYWSVLLLIYPVEQDLVNLQFHLYIKQTLHLLSTNILKII